MKKISLLLLLLFAVFTGKAQEVGSFGDNTTWSYLVGFIDRMEIDEDDEEWQLWLELEGYTEPPVFFVYEGICEYAADGVSVKNGKTYDNLKVRVYHLDGGGTAGKTKIGSSTDDDIYGRDVPGLRMADGRIYVDEEEYIDFLRSYDWSFPGCDSSYIPYKRTGDGEIVLYDFTMKAGDMFEHVDGYEDIYVTDVRDTCLTDGVSRRLLTLSNKMKLLEGVGCLNSKGMLYFYLNTSVSTAETQYLSDGQQLFAGLKGFWNSNSDKVYSLSDEDIVTNGIRQVAMRHGGGRDADASVYDLSGRRVTGTPRAGVYIKGGRKIVVR